MRAAALFGARRAEEAAAPRRAWAAGRGHSSASGEAARTLSRKLPPLARGICTRMSTFSQRVEGSSGISARACACCCFFWVWRQTEETDSALCLPPAATSGNNSQPEERKEGAGAQVCQRAPPPPRSALALSEPTQLQQPLTKEPSCMEKSNPSLIITQPELLMSPASTPAPRRRGQIHGDFPAAPLF